MPEYYRGMIIGGVIAFTAILACWTAYESGKQAIVAQCLEHRAFTYGDGAWGCMRLRKGVRDVESDTLIQPTPNEGIL